MVSHWVSEGKGMSENGFRRKSLLLFLEEGGLFHLQAEFTSGPEMLGNGPDFILIKVKFI